MSTNPSVLLSCYPCPQEIGFDNGSEFKMEFQDLCVNIGLKRCPSNAWNPQTNDILEQGSSNSNDSDDESSVVVSNNKRRIITQIADKWVKRKQTFNSDYAITGLALSTIGKFCAEPESISRKYL